MTDALVLLGFVLPLGLDSFAVAAAIGAAGAPGAALDNPVLRAEGRVTLVDGLLAAAVSVGLVLNAGVGWWWADPVAGYLLVLYAAREVREAFRGN